MADALRRNAFWLAGAAVGAHLTIMVILSLQLAGVRQGLRDVELSVDLVGRGVDQQKH